MNNENKFFGPDQETNQDMQQETPIQVEEPIYNKTEEPTVSVVNATNSKMDESNQFYKYMTNNVPSQNFNNFTNDNEDNFNNYQASYYEKNYKKPQKKQNAFKIIILTLLGIIIGAACIILVIGIAFDYITWPGIKDNITDQTQCDTAYDCVEINDEESICKYKDENDVELDITCKR